MKLGGRVVESEQGCQPEITVHGMDVETRDGDAMRVRRPGTLAGAGPSVPVGFVRQMTRGAALNLHSRPIEADPRAGAAGQGKEG